ncbi:hypothetical protein [Natrinema sp. DC36]|uniref:hypothetical protein n=1 Tax=Natrinema sp. DC36 TaxID=2878680 RepID=UPI001CEFCD1C|nr:hypothetical protein [Natrinema sp. DC36]
MATTAQQFLSTPVDPNEYTTSEEGQAPEIREPDHQIPVDTNFSGPFFRAIGKRKLQGRDAKTLVTADHAETGVGKSSCCDFLGYVCDTTEDGFSEEKVAIDPPEFFDLYGVVPAESAIVLEEGEQLDARRAMSNENVDASHTWAKERIRELIAFINLPSPEMIDGRLELLADFWINIEVRGRARIYKKKINRIKRVVYYETMQVLEWPNMDGSDTFQLMKQQKEDHLDDDDSGVNWVRQSEVDKMLEQREKEVRRESRDEYIRKLVNECGCSRCEEEFRQKDIAPAFDLSPGRVSQIAQDR